MKLGQPESKSLTGTLKSVLHVRNGLLYFMRAEVDVLCAQKQESGAVHATPSTASASVTKPAAPLFADTPTGPPRPSGWDDVYEGEDNGELLPQRRSLKLTSLRRLQLAMQCGILLQEDPEAIKTDTTQVHGL